MVSSVPSSSGGWLTKVHLNASLLHDHLGVTEVHVTTSSNLHPTPFTLHAPCARLCSRLQRMRATHALAHAATVS